MAAAIRRYFDVAIYLLLFTGFGTLASTGRLDTPTVLVVTAALLYRGYVLARRREALLSERWTNLLTIACVGFFVADEFFISGAFLPATVHLVLFVMLVRLFSAQKDRDHYFLAVLSFLMVLAAAVLTVDSTFLFALGGFVLVGISAFILMEMVHSSQNSPVQARGPQIPRAYRRLSFAVATVAPLLLLLVFVFGGGIFFLLPRVSAGYLSAYAGGNDLSTGFADRVELGRIGRIQQSRSVVMHVQFEGGHPAPFGIKLRGVTLSEFDGRNWAGEHLRVPLRRAADGRFHLHQSWPSTGEGRRVRYRVTLEPMIGDVFFLLGTAEAVQGNYTVLSQDSSGDVFDADRERPVTQYDAESVIRRPASADLRGREEPAQAFSQYLQLPPLDPRVLSLARQITASARTPLDKAVVLEGYLRSHYSYTLQLPESAPKDPIADFLFVRRQGHCEYFASSMALMLRAVGVPSRIVNGFSGGEFNDVSSQYLVRASDAHSWVEAYIPGFGWMEFDPTPPGSPQAQTQWSRLMLYMDALSSFWREWVINYDLAHQLRLGQDASQGSRHLVSLAQSWARGKFEQMLVWARRIQARIGDAAVKWTLRALLLLAVGLAVASFPRLAGAVRRFRLARHPEKSPQTAATIWYERMLRQASRRGWQKSPAQTPQEFVLAIEDSELQGKISEFTDRYENARFGRSAEDVGRLPGILEEIQNLRS